MGCFEGHGKLLGIAPRGVVVDGRWERVKEKPQRRWLEEGTIEKDRVIGGEWPVWRGGEGWPRRLLLWRVVDHEMLRGST